MDSSSKLSDFAFGRQVNAKHQGYTNGRLPVTSAKAAKAEESAAKEQTKLPELDKKATTEEIVEAVKAVGPEISKHMSPDDKKKMKDILDGKQEGSGEWYSKDNMKQLAKSDKGKMGMVVIVVLILAVVGYKMVSKKKPDPADTSKIQDTGRAERVALARAALSATMG